MVKKVLYILAILFVTTISAQESSNVEYTKPGGFDFITLGPQTMSRAWDMSFSKEALPTWATIFASSSVNALLFCSILLVSFVLIVLAFLDNFSAR